MSGNSLGISVRLQPLSASRASGQQRHDSRAHTPSYVDATKSSLNRVGKPIDIPALVREVAEHRAASHQQRLRKDAQVIVSGVITFGVEAQKKIAALSPAEQEMVFSVVANRIAAESGREFLKTRRISSRNLKTV